MASAICKGETMDCRHRENLPQPEGSLPNADYASDRILSLPLFPSMTDQDAGDVVQAVKAVIARNRK